MIDPPTPIGWSLAAAERQLRERTGLPTTDNDRSRLFHMIASGFSWQLAADLVEARLR